LNRYYVLHTAQFDTVCLSYVPFASESDATAARASIVAGTPFAQTGQVTPLGCAMRYALSSLPSSVTSLTKGKVSQPVAGGNGQYALFEVTSSKHSGFVAARVGVENAVLNAGSARTSVLIQAADRRAQVTADPRYGRVAPKTVALRPAKSPAPAFVLNPTVNLASSPKSQVSSGSSTAG
ncbi:MAG TPA: hypothetical protein VHW47_05515, partial [Acidimicrobiales bacterium]|nr:hypothetical protein [Acidimicrobiales bacterium]